VTAILKTWPAFMPPEKVLEVFTHQWAVFYFTLGRGKPKDAGVNQIYYTHRGRILGHFDIGEIVQNVGQLPKLTAIDGTESEWQIRGDAWVAVCPPPFHRLEEKLYHEGFRGWRYFDLEKFRGTLESKVRL
jgi:hypothetical protein